MRRSWLAPLIMCLPLLMAPGHPNPGVSGGGGLGATVNEPQDTDGDAQPDTIYCADYHPVGAPDGILTMQDVQACYDALTDTNSKTLFILPGTYAAGTTAQVLGFLEIAGDTNFWVQCFPGAVLQGIGVDGADKDISIAHISSSSKGMVFGCDWDGQAGATYTSLAETFLFKMGIFVLDSDDITIESNIVHDTQSIGIFINGGDRNKVLRNHVYYVGGYNDTAVSPATNAGIEVFTDADATIARDNEIAFNNIEYVGSVGYTSRKTSATDTLTGTKVYNNTFHRTKSPAIRLGGELNSHYYKNTMKATAGCVSYDETGGNPTDFFPTDVRATANVLFEDSDCQGPQGSSSFAFDITRFQTNNRFINVRIDGAMGGGWNLEQRQRGLLIEGGHTKNSVGNGMQEVAVAGALPDESRTIRNHLIDGVDSDEMAHPLFLGVMTELAAQTYCTDGASPCACSTDREGEWLVTNNAGSATDVTFMGGTGTVMNRAICTAGVWVDKVTNSLTAGNPIAMSMLGADLVIDNVTLNHFPNSAIALATTALTNRTNIKAKAIGDRWGFLGEIDEAAANALNCGSNPWMEGRWAIITNASGSTDCTVSSGTGATVNYCFCSSGVVDVWTDALEASLFTTARHGLSLPAMTGDGITIDMDCTDIDSDGSCINIPASTTATNGKIKFAARFRTTASAGIRTNYGLTVTALGAGWVAEGICSNIENAACINNNDFIVADYKVAAAPTTTYCDGVASQALGSTWQRTDNAGSADQFYVCEDADGAGGGAAAWDLK
jgi:parallel beta-helix repeat protein